MKGRTDKRERRYAIYSILPALIMFIAFTYYPLVISAFYSFTDWNGYSRNYNIVGLKNYFTVLSESAYLNVIGNTLYFAIVGIAIGLMVQFSLALILSQRFKGAAMMQTFIYIPVVLSSIIVSYTWTGILQYTGVINEVLLRIGLDSLVHDWLMDKDTARIVVVLVSTWQYTGYGVVLFLAGLNAIPKEVEEAAKLDGASYFQRLWRVTVPLLMPAITIVLFISITGALKTFELPMILTGGGPLDMTRTITMAINEVAFGYNLFGEANALGILFFLFIASITLLQLWLTSRKEVDY